MVSWRRLAPLGVVLVLLFGLQIVPEQPVPRDRSFKESNALPVAGRRQVHKGAVRQNVAGRPCRRRRASHGILFLVLVRILSFLRSSRRSGGGEGSSTRCIWLLRRHDYLGVVPQDTYNRRLMIRTLRSRLDSSKR